MSAHFQKGFILSRFLMVLMHQQRSLLKNNKLKRSSIDTQLKSIAAGALGLFAGFSIKP